MHSINQSAMFSIHKQSALSVTKVMSALSCHLSPPTTHTHIHSHALQMKFVCAGFQIRMGGTDVAGSNILRCSYKYSLLFLFDSQVHGRLVLSVSQRINKACKYNKNVTFCVSALQ